MAIIGQLTLDQVLILEVDTDPSVNPVAAGIGSMATLYDGVNGRLWLKTAAADSGWTLIPRQSGATALVNGQFLFGDANGNIQQTPRAYWDGAGRFAFGLNAPAAPQSTIHLDRGTGVGTHVRFTAGTTTGVAAGDGFEVGIDDAGNAELRQYENSNLNIYTNNTLAATFTSTGKTLIGTSNTPIDITGLSAIPQFQIIGIASVQMAQIQYSADTIAPVFNAIKSRGATVGTHALLLADDELGRFQFRGSDGTNFQAGASIRALVDGTAAAGSMPGRLIMMTTPAGSTTPVEAMRIDSTGLVRVVGTLRSRSGITDTTVQATANTTTSLVATSNGVQVFTGTTAGQILKMPDATTLLVGQQFIVYNQASVSVAVQNTGGGAIKTSPNNSITVVSLQDNSTANGVWSATVSFDSAYQEVSATAGAAITSGTDVLVTGMTITPAAGTYAVTFTSTGSYSNSNTTQTISIYAGGVQNANSSRTVGSATAGLGATQDSAITTNGTVTVNGSQAIEIRARRSANTFTINARTMTIIRVG